MLNKNEIDAFDAALEAATKRYSIPEDVLCTYLVRTHNWQRGGLIEPVHVEAAAEQLHAEWVALELYDRERRGGGSD